jgi:hypothetical protein
MWKLILLLICAGIFLLYIKSWNRKKMSNMKMFEGRWRKAREERISWQENYRWLGFDHPEYQRLWEMEISAEMTYLICMQISILGIVLARGTSVSWPDYCFERKKSEQENDED